MDPPSSTQDDVNLLRTGQSVSGVPNSQASSVSLSATATGEPPSSPPVASISIPFTPQHVRRHSGGLQLSAIKGSPFRRVSTHSPLAQSFAPVHEATSVQSGQMTATVVSGSPSAAHSEPRTSIASEQKPMMNAGSKSGSFTSERRSPSMGKLSGYASTSEPKASSGLTRSMTADAKLQDMGGNGLDVGSPSMDGRIRAVPIPMPLRRLSRGSIYSDTESSTSGSPPQFFNSMSPLPPPARAFMSSRR
jgi:hypothetical protein